MSKNYTNLYYGTVALVLAAGIVFVPAALFAAIPASIGLFLFGMVFKKYALRFHEAFIAAFWTAFGYLAISMLVALLLYFRAVYFQDYKMSFYPSWLLNYYTPRYFPQYYKIISVLHIVCILASAFILHLKLKPIVISRMLYGFSLAWTAAVILPCLLFGLYAYLYVLRHLCPDKLQSAIGYMLIK
ncbi:MAG: hypothetical protein CFE23_10770 [Flavobacterium sp. BFFFF1]|uniref:hypothetical protein n=1 Tax=Flavobacterium sp. BFFFF1 TaxID=2015557 RepID=UPI000BD3B221|nr:hypothetical protein [Flavobacterium sp. BFFFF1]OYU80191.1 MAG: hypothetical protein CFE23_10770 [Flavobacterium sp. BFFFF1]